MNKKKLQSSLEFMIFAFIMAAAFIHVLATVLRWFIPINEFSPIDYIPGIIAAVIAALVSLFLFLYVRDLSRIRAGFFLTAAIMLLYLRSCTVWSRISQINEFSNNKIILYDTFVLLFLIYPLGHYIARWKNPVLFRAFLNLLLAAGTIFILFVLVTVFRNTPVEVPKGTWIQMQPYYVVGEKFYRLEIACNPNTTGLVESIAFLLSIILIFVNRTVPGRILPLLAVPIHYTGLVLSISRTSIAASLGGAALMIFLFLAGHPFKAFHKRKLVPAAILALVFLVAAVFFQRVILRHSESIYNPSKKSAALPVSYSPSLSFSDGNPEAFSLRADAKSALSPAASVQAGVRTCEELSWSIVRTGMPGRSAGSAGAVSGLSHARAIRTDRTDVRTAAGIIQNVSVPDAARPAEKKTHGPLYKKLDALLSGRLHIWGYAVSAITASPERIRYGATPGHIFDSMNEAAGRKVGLYTHNQFLEIALALGIPALLIFILFLLCTLRSCITLFKNHREDPLHFMLPIFLLLLLLCNMMEATLMFHRFLSSYTFFFLCGWINERGAITRRRMRKAASKKRFHQNTNLL